MSYKNGSFQPKHILLSHQNKLEKHKSIFFSPSKGSFFWSCTHTFTQAQAAILTDLLTSWCTLVILHVEWCSQCFSDAFDLLFGVVILRLQDRLDISHIQGQGTSASMCPSFIRPYLWCTGCNAVFPLQTTCSRPTRSLQVATRRWRFQSACKRTQTPNPVHQKQPATRAARSSSEVKEKEVKRG